MENNQFEEDRLFFVDQMEIFLRQKMLPEAEALAAERLAKFPSDIDARILSNLILIEEGKIAESRNMLEGLEKDITQLSFGYLRAANAYQEKELNQDALSCYQKYLSLNPRAENYQEVAEKIAVLQGEGNHSEEVDESGIVDSPGPEFYTLTLAELYIRQGHAKMAADILTEIIKREPTNVQARVKLDAVKAAFVLNSSPHDAVESTNNLIKTLSCWLENIGRLKKHAK